MICCEQKLCTWSGKFHKRHSKCLNYARLSRPLSQSSWDGSWDCEQLTSPSKHSRLRDLTHNCKHYFLVNSYHDYFEIVDCFIEVRVNDVVGTDDPRHLGTIWPAVLFGPCARAHQREDPNCIDEFDARKSIGEYRRWNQTEFESRLDNKSLFWHQNVETLSNRKRTEGNHDEYRNKPLVEVVLPRSLLVFVQNAADFNRKKYVQTMKHEKSRSQPWVSSTLLERAWQPAGCCLTLSDPSFVQVWIQFNRSCSTENLHSTAARLHHYRKQGHKDVLEEPQLTKWFTQWAVSAARLSENHLPRFLARPSGIILRKPETFQGKSWMLLSKKSKLTALQHCNLQLSFCCHGKIARKATFLRGPCVWACHPNFSWQIALPHFTFVLIKS